MEWCGPRLNDNARKNQATFFARFKEKPYKPAQQKDAAGRIYAPRS
jgi:hypothetical protein